ncbi:hypothetical protein [Leptothermofonsia sp. ETS-13]|uniref:hypothetical protein n=1 Tax=Leptothermofonsia sp. ETS-13 TaxID=3035696 RepID=UPI003BA1D869
MKIFALLHSARASRVPDVHSSTAGSRHSVQKQLAGVVSLTALLLAPSVILLTPEIAAAGGHSCCGGRRHRPVKHYPSRVTSSSCKRPSCPKPVRPAPPIVVERPSCTPSFCPPPFQPPVAIRPPIEVEGLRYVVAIPGDNLEELMLVQRFAPGAFLADSRLGMFINAGSFSEREPAEIRADVLRAYGFDAQVRHRDF